jgi:hypothetical protein
MIADGIKYLCRKIVDLVGLVEENGLDVDSSITFTQIKHKEWVHRILSIYEKMKQWEADNNGE